MQEENLPQAKWHEKRERSTIQIDGELVGFTLYQFDARSNSQRTANTQSQSLNGNLIVYIPGHGQTAAAAKNLIAQILSLAPAKVLWTIDFDPPKGGDPVKAKALIELLHQKAGQALFGAPDAPLPAVSLFGWSHGAGESIRTVAQEPALFQHLVCLCPAGIIDRSAFELVISFTVESLRILIDALLQFNNTILRVSAVGLDIGLGILKDLLHTKSPSQVINDIRWASRQAPSPDNPYDGHVVILFGRKDTVIRWRDVFPDVQDPAEIRLALESFQEQNFPQARDLQVRVLDGNHIAPEIKAPLYIQTAFSLINSPSKH